MVVQGDDVTEETDADGNVTSGQYNGMTEEFRTRLQQVAQSAVAMEGDAVSINIVDHNFETAGVAAINQAMETRAATEQMAMNQKWYMSAGLIALIIVSFFILRSMFKKSVIWPQDEKPEEKVKEIPAATLEDMRRQEVAAEISQLSMEDPEAIAALLRSWMSEDED